MIVMMTKRTLAVTVLAILAGPIMASAQGDYEYELVNYPGSISDQIFGVNNRGDAVGEGLIDPDGIPFVYDSKKGTFTDVSSVDGYDETVVLGISDSGVLVGRVVDFDLGVESGLILDKKGNATVFDHPDAFGFTEARGVNENGLVAGFRDSVDDVFGPENGFIYDPKRNTFTDIVPSLFTIAQGINSRGDVVGSSVFETANGPCPGSNDFFSRYGWLRTADGSVTFFDVNGWQTNARGITDSGTIAGWARDPITGLVKSFVVKLDGSQCQSITLADDELLAVPGAANTFAQDITNSGVVAGSFDFGSQDLSQGFIATPKK
jgi:hypothetical protein